MPCADAHYFMSLLLLLARASCVLSVSRRHYSRWIATSRDALNLCSSEWLKVYGTAVAAVLPLGLRQHLNYNRFRIYHLMASLTITHVSSILSVSQCRLMKTISPQKNLIIWRLVELSVRRSRRLENCLLTCTNHPTKTHWTLRSHLR